MAATDPRRQEIRPGLVRTLPWVAAGLGALAARDACAQSNLDFRYLYYKESGGRTEVQNPTVLLNQDFGEGGGLLSLLLGYDTISGASPTGGYPTADTTSSASGSTTSGSVPLVAYHDHRRSGTLSYARRFGANLPSVDLSYSKENDYLARSAGFSDAWTLAHGRGTLHLAASASRDVVSPVTNHLALDKSENGLAAGWTWIVGERDLFDVSGSLMRLTGYLDDPYKIVPVGATTLPDHRPDARTRKALLAKYGHYYTVRGALRTVYRYYWDDWGIRAHTVDLQYDQRYGSRWIVSPRLRLYTQTAASFYGSSFAAPQPFMSADYRLSPFDSVLGGLTVAYEIRPGMTVSIGTTSQSQRGRDRVTPISTTPPGEFPAEDGGVGTVSAADVTTTTWTVGLSWRY